MNRRTTSIASTALALFALAGCGGPAYFPTPSSADFLVRASASDINTSGQVALTSFFPSGESAPVRWTIEGADNAEALGPGHIDANGVYTPPNALSQNTVTVRIHAELMGRPADATTLIIRVHPGFVQPLLPEVATLSTGSAMRAGAEIAEVGDGEVNWSLSTSPTGIGSTEGLGSLGAQDCRRIAGQYTTCKVTYTAPPNLPQTDTVYLIASVNGTQTTAASEIRLNNHGLNSTPEAHQAVQGTGALLGSSGGNDGDYDTYTSPGGKSYIADCCGGTLGALVQDDAKDLLLLSNNHVLAESDQAHVGDAIDQPGLMDGSCKPTSEAGSIIHPIGSLRAYVPIASRQSNVDAALASINSGAVNGGGQILELGPLAHGWLSPDGPAAGAGEALKPEDLAGAFVKSGRTTGLTCSYIDAVDLTVKVNYYRDCAETQPYYTKTFEHQIGIGGQHFTDSGDSGALVLDARSAEAIGLYFAGGTDGDGAGLSLVNPIGDVLKELGGAVGSNLSIVGGAPHPVACIDYDTRTRAASWAIPDIWRARAQSAAPAVQAALGGVALGSAAGASLDDPGQPALIVYLDPAQQATVAQVIGGLRTQVIRTTAADLARGDAPSLPEQPAGIHLSADGLHRAEHVVEQHRNEMMSDPAIFGVGVGESLDDPSEPAVLVLIDLRQLPQRMPAVIEGVRVRYLRLQRFHVTRTRNLSGRPAASCALAPDKAGAWKPRP